MFKKKTRSFVVVMVIVFQDFITKTIKICKIKFQFYSFRKVHSLFGRNIK